MGQIKLPAKELIIAAFCGGIVTSLLELANMLASRAHDEIFDPYFWVGFIVAGIIGVLGLFVSQAKDLGGAITSGVAAPQLLGGLGKVAPTVVSLLFAPLNTPVYAGEDFQDSITVKTIVEGNYKVLEIRPVNSTQKGVLIRDTMTVKLPTGDLEIYGDDHEGIQFCIDKDTVNEKEVVVRIRATDHVVQKEQHHPIQRILRGAFGHRKEKKKTKKLELTVEEKPIEKDTTAHE